MFLFIIFSLSSHMFLLSVFGSNFKLDCKSILALWSLFSSIQFALTLLFLNTLAGLKNSVHLLNNIMIATPTSYTLLILYF